MMSAGKTKIMFILPSYRIGGITSSLYSLLSLLDVQKICAYIYAVSDVGEYKDKMPNCKKISANWRFSMSSDGLRGSHLVLHKVKMLTIKFCKNIKVDIVPLLMHMADRSLHFDQYDAIVCFSESLATYCCHIPSAKKIAWIHCDYSRHLSLFPNTVEECAAYEKYNKIVCVSKYAKDRFDEIFPQFSHKTLYIHNVINEKEIREKSKDTSGLSTLFNSSFFTIISVGRLDPVKGFDLIPSIAKDIKRRTSISFRWYIIGGGNDIVMQDILSKIAENRVEDCVILLGPQTNIYPYLAHSNLYVCTSHSESFPMVINEAKALCVPVVSNAFPSAMESINEGVDGFVVSNENMSIKIVEIMNRRMRIDEPRFDNESILKQVYELFNIELC